MSDNRMIWHPAGELPPLHEESFEDEDTVFRCMASDWLLVRDDLCSDTRDDPYTAPVHISRFVRESTRSMWEDGNGRCRAVTCWMPLPEFPEVAEA